MKITRSRLRQIIKEEITKPLNEAEPADGAETTDATGAQPTEEPAKAEETEDAEESDPRAGKLAEEGKWITMTAVPTDSPVSVIVNGPDKQAVEVIYGTPSGAKGKIGDMVIRLGDGVDAIRAEALKAAKEMQAEASKPYGIKSYDLDKLGKFGNEETVELIASSESRAIIVEPIPEKK